PEGHLQVLPQHLHRIDPAHCRRDGKAHGVTDSFLSGDHLLFHLTAFPAKALHADWGNASAEQFGEHLTLERPAFEGTVKTIERQLARIEWVVVPKHLEVNTGILVSGESDEAHFSLPPGLSEGLDHAAAHEVTVGIVVVGAFVYLPEIEIIRLEPAKRLFELPHRLPFVTAVRADLRHQKHPVAPVRECLTHDLF